MFVVAHFHMVMGVAPILVIFGGDLPLVPQDHRADAERDAGPVPLLGHLPRRLCDLLPDALPGPAGRAAPLLRRSARRPSSRNRPQTLNAFITRRGADRRRRPDGVPVQPDLEPVQGQAGRRQSLERHHAGMADAARPRRGTATGARSCRWSIAGPMTTACPAPSRTSCRRTSRRPRGLRQEAGAMSVIITVLGCDSEHRRVVALATEARQPSPGWKQGRDRRPSRWRAHSPLPTAKIGLRRVPRRRHGRCSCSSSAHMPCGWRMGTGGPLPDAEAPVAEHGHAGPEQRSDAMGAECITSRRN